MRGCTNGEILRFDYRDKMQAYAMMDAVKGEILAYIVNPAGVIDWASGQGYRIAIVSYPDSKKVEIIDIEKKAYIDL